MIYLRQEFVNIAKSWIGKNESDGSFKEIIDIYNSHKPLARGYTVKYTDEWCATFVSAVSIKCGYTAIVPTECGCEKMVDLFKKIGCWDENDARVPNPGDIIFYDWEDNGKGDNTGRSNHVGIVEKVSGSTITIIEGNYNESVKRRTIKVDAKYIRGYGVPKYDNAPAKPTKPAKPVKPKVIYQVYAGGRWLGEITGYNMDNDNGYAGIFGKPISGIRVKLSNGKTVTLRSHIKGRFRSSWLPAVTKWDNTSSGYSGIYNKPIDCVAMKAEGYTLKYRVHVKDGGWLNWVSKYDISDYVNGLAGAYGKVIDAIQIDVV